MPQMMPINWVMILAANVFFLYMIMISISSMNIAIKTKFQVLGKGPDRGEKFSIEWK